MPEPETTMDALKKIMSESKMSKEDLYRLVSDDAKKKREKRQIQVEEAVFVGVITYTCNTCGSVFERNFCTNVDGDKKKLHAAACSYCREVLLNETKDVLIDKILCLIGNRKIC